MSIEKRIEKLEQRAGGKRRIICVRHVGDRKWTEAEDKEMLTQLPDRPGLYVVWWNGEKFTKWREMGDPPGQHRIFEGVNHES